jgi:glycosyltransferase involved in cell wall biosynthesis
MKVLVLSLYHPELVRGGAQTVAYDVFRSLKSRDGIHATFLAAIDPSHAALYKAGARITGFDGRADEFLFLSRDYDEVWSKTSDVALADSLIAFLHDIKPDIVHVHHFIRFGIDVLSLIRRHLPAAKIIMTLHDFHTICAADGLMVRLTDGALCDRASPVRCHQCLPERPPEHFFMRAAWMQTHLRHVDIFTTPSRYMIEHFVTWGLPRGKFVPVPNGTAPPPAPPATQAVPGARNRFGFFGQLVDAKGLHVLLDAVTNLRAEGFADFTVEINGGNLHFASDLRRARIEAFRQAEAERPHGERNVVFNGPYHPDQTASRMQRIDWCVIPSVCWESYCLVISEAWAHGRPVIASAVGGPAERVTNGADGILFDMGDANALARAIRGACMEAGLWDHLAAGIKPPTTHDTMADAFIDIYTQPQNHTKWEGALTC